MADVACVRVIWERQYIPLPPIRNGDQLIKFRPVYVEPETEYPGGRKGAALAGAWRQFGRTADGMLILDGDVVIDPIICTPMFNAIHSDPQQVWTAPVRIWPVSTNRPTWVWGHWEEEASQELDMYPKYFSFNFTYLPKKLLEGCIKGGMKNWVYPRVDACVSAEARKLGIKAQMVEDCWPVHLHF